MLFCKIVKKDEAWSSWTGEFCVRCIIYEPRHEKTGFLHMRKQRRRSASR